MSEFEQIMFEPTSTLPILSFGLIMTRNDFVEARRVIFSNVRTETNLTWMSTLAIIKKLLQKNVIMHCSELLRKVVLDI